MVLWDNFVFASMEVYDEYRGHEGEKENKSHANPFLTKCVNHYHYTHKLQKDTNTVPIKLYNNAKKSKYKYNKGNVCFLDTLILMYTTTHWD